MDGAVEVAAEVVEHSSSPSERSLASSCRRRDLVSAFTIFFSILKPTNFEK